MRSTTTTPAPRCYVLCMYPYLDAARPTRATSATTLSVICWSGQEDHAGPHAVLSPIGFDSFGLPAENAAIKTGIHPRIFTEARIEELKTSLKRLGAVYDWRRELRSHDPLYGMRWNQLIFLRFLEAGLAYRKNAPVNWCPGCQTVLANEQVLPDGTCERSGDPEVVQARPRAMVLSHHQLCRRAAGRPRRCRLAREGQDDATELDRSVRRRRVRTDCWSKVATTTSSASSPPEPDTSFGMTFVVLAPRSTRWSRRSPRPITATRSAPSSSGSGARPTSSANRARETSTKRGSVHGQVCRQSVHGSPGAGLPGRLRPDDVRHRRHHGGSRPGPARLGFRHRLRPCRSSGRCAPPEGWEGQAFIGDGPAINSDFSWTAFRSPKGSQGPRHIEWLEAQGIGDRKVNYRLRDWLLSRQRYWEVPDSGGALPEHWDRPST